MQEEVSLSSLLDKVHWLTAQLAIANTEEDTAEVSALLVAAQRAAIDHIWMDVGLYNPGERKYKFWAPAGGVGGSPSGESKELQEVRAAAANEVAQEEFRRKVEEEKARLRKNRGLPWWKRLIPFTVSFQWRKA